MSQIKTPGQRFAEEYGSKAVEEMLSAIKWAHKMALGLTIMVMAASFNHQRTYLVSHGMDPLGSIVAPLAIDTMTLLCVKVLSAAGMAKPAKRIALGALLFPVLASAYVNFVGSHSLVAGIVYVILVLFIAVAELIKSFIKPDFAAILVEEQRVQPAAEVGRKRSAAEQARITAKANLTREKNRVMALDIATLRVEALTAGIDTDGMRKPQIQRALIQNAEMDAPAVHEPAAANR